MNYVAIDRIDLPGRTVEPGEEITAEELEGIDVDRLVGIGALSAGDVESGGSETGKTVELEYMTKVQLLELAAQLGLEFKPRTPNAELIEAIKEARKATEAEDESIEIDQMTKEQLLALADQMALEVDAELEQADLVEVISTEVVKRTATDLGIDIEGMDTDAILDAITAKQAENQA